MGWIVPMGVADSKSAMALREVFLSNKLIEIADLEALSNEVFTSGIATSRGTVAPIVLIVERGSGPKDYGVLVTVANREECLKNGSVMLSNAPASVVKKSVFSDDSINPFHQFITKIQEADLPILRKLMSHPPLKEFAAPAPTKTRKDNRAVQVGIQTGRGRGKIFREAGAGRFKMIKGSHLHTFALNEGGIAEFVDLSKVDSKSLWSRKEFHNCYAFALSEVGWARQACRFNTGDYVAQKTAVVFIPEKGYEDFPWDAYLNSQIPRFLFGLVFRTSLLEGKDDLWRAHINTSAIELFPVPDKIFEYKEEIKTLHRGDP